MSSYNRDKVLECSVNEMLVVFLVKNSIDQHLLSSCISRFSF